MRPAGGPEIVIVEDDSSYRAALTYLLTSVGYTVQAFGSAADFLETWEQSGPACVLLDLRLPGVNGLDLYRQCIAGQPDITTVFLTAFADVATSVQAMKSGAFDFLEKPVRRDHLLSVIDAALTNLERDVEEARRADDARRRFETLTPREREVMELIVDGLLNKQIARQLGISLRTVKVHRGRVMTKMQVDRLAGLMSEASRLGLIDGAADQPTVH